MSDHALTPIEAQFDAHDGLRLHYHAWEAPSPAAGLVIVHGLAEHGGRYIGLGTALSGRGVSTYAIDQRGHGRSGGPRGHAPSFDALLSDLADFSRIVRDRLGPDVPLAVLGMSMGGLVVLRFLEEHPSTFDAGVIVSPWLETAVPVPRWKSLLVGPLSKVLPSLPFVAGIPAEFLSHDPDIVQRYRDDPLVHDRITPRLFSAAAKAQQLVFVRRDRIRGPILFMLAGADRIVNTGRTLEFTRSLSVPDVTVQVYPDYYHEVLNEPGPAAYADLTAWLDARLGESPADSAGEGGRE